MSEKPGVDEKAEQQMLRKIEVGGVNGGSVRFFVAVAVVAENIDRASC